MAALSLDAFSGDAGGECSADVRARVVRARARHAALRVLPSAMKKMSLSARG